MEGKIYHLTKEKLAELKKEYEELMARERMQVVGVEAPKILESDEMNPEFVSFQEDMDKLRARIDELDYIMGHHELIKNPPKEHQETVLVGATVHVDLAGKKDQFMIVGTLEANPEEGRISNESPVGKALLGHKIGDAVMVDAPSKKVYKIKDIKYEIS